jgi:broad specificity phosphatase PhoE
MGEWEGMSFAELEHRDDWKRFNAYRSGEPCPGGEFMAETQIRMIRQLDCLRRRHAEETVAIVSHADPLRAVVAYVMGIPLDLIHRFEIGHASVSVVQMADWGPRVLCLNLAAEATP